MMTLEEAIKHCEEKACGDTECAAEHKQLAEWLKELQAMKSLSSNLDEAATEYENETNPTCTCEECLIKSFKTGAEWMAGQGVKATATVGYYNQSGLSILTEPCIKKLGFKEGDELEITIRKK